jgi:hypothetical protein
MTFRLRLLTAIVMFAVSLALCGFDYCMSWYDNDATISKLILWISTHAPVTSMIFAFWLGILAGHLFLPQIPLSERSD